MFNKIIRYFYEYKNTYKLSLIKKQVKLINLMVLKIEKLNNKNLSNKTYEFIDRLNNGENIDFILIEAFAVIKESIKRICNINLFDVQLIGGIILHNKCIAEMSTGEGKTLTATLPAYLNSLYKRGVHIVTMNDYLAKRDAFNNKDLFEFLNISVGVNLNGMSFKEKKESYLCDITYGTNNEYGFDYLKDNMIFNINEKIQRELYYSIIDEVDSILIDEARTPLILSGFDKDYSYIYIKINSLIKYLINKDNIFNYKSDYNKYYKVDKKYRQIILTEYGFKLIEKIMVNLNFIKKEKYLYKPENIFLIHHIILALKANILFKKDVDYIILNNKVIIVDEHTGRTVEGRRWSEGLHQAIEAKENINIQNESQNLASITFQSYFKLYEKLSGMTGTAYTEKEEFKYIYNLDTIIVPTNKLMIRKDLPDIVFLTEEEKINAILIDIKDCFNRKQPVLVGTSSIKKSEFLSNKLKKNKIPHKILNAKYNDIEADIISQAGKPGSITISTNMAGRGTDIILGGNYNNEIKKLKIKDKLKIEEIKRKWKVDNSIVLKSGGLHIIGTERHESRRIDNQLRGRSGRQGDPGSSRFYLSMEDPLIKIFISDNILLIIKKLNIKFGESFEHKWINNAIENAQEKLEKKNFEIRKQLIIYESVSNNQRNIIYEIRKNFLFEDNINYIVENIIFNVIQNILFKYIPNNSINIFYKIKELNEFLIQKLNFKFNLFKLVKKDFLLKNNFYIYRKTLLKKIMLEINSNEILIERNKLKKLKKIIFLKKLDLFWKNHIYMMDVIRQNINLRCYTQKDPKQEYQKESFYLFKEMINLWKYESISNLNEVLFKIKKDSNIDNYINK